MVNDLVAIGLFSVAFGARYGMYIPEFVLVVRKYYGLSLYGTIFGTLLTSFGVGAFISPVLEEI